MPFKIFGRPPTTPIRPTMGQLLAAPPSKQGVLPGDVYKIILPHLPTSELIRLRKICKLWAKLIEQLPFSLPLSNTIGEEINFHYLKDALNRDPVLTTRIPVKPIERKINYKISEEINNNQLKLYYSLLDPPHPSFPSRVLVFDSTDIPTSPLPEEECLLEKLRNKNHQKNVHIYYISKDIFTCWFREENIYINYHLKDPSTGLIQRGEIFQLNTYEDLCYYDPQIWKHFIIVINEHRVDFFNLLEKGKKSTFVNPNPENGNWFRGHRKPFCTSDDTNFIWSDANLAHKNIYVISLDEHHNLLLQTITLSSLLQQIIPHILAQQNHGIASLVDYPIKIIDHGIVALLRWRNSRNPEYLIVWNQSKNLVSLFNVNERFDLSDLSCYKDKEILLACYYTLAFSNTVNTGMDLHYYHPDALLKIRLYHLPSGRELPSHKVSELIGPLFQRGVRPSLDPQLLYDIKNLKVSADGRGIDITFNNKQAEEMECKFRTPYLNLSPTSEAPPEPVSNQPAPSRWSRVIGMMQKYLINPILRLWTLLRSFFAY